MSLCIYNTLTRNKCKFVPIKAGEIGMYTCGVTVYDFCHIGHARSVVIFDVIYRYLLSSGYKVIFVRNFTDIDDKIIRKSQEDGVQWHEVASRFIKAFKEDMKALGIKKPTYEPRATEFIGEMINMIKELEKKGFAYRIGGDVFFSVEKFSGYGKLSGRKLKDMLAGARVKINSKKKNPYDFSLWKTSKAGEPKWDSPWGPGRPGWHLECSAMSCHILGKTFDIHGGGEDLIFPHHENEIAQAEAANGVPFVNYWIHHGFVKINKEKMSKSLGNFFTIREVLKRYHPEVLRLFLLSKHYRSPVDFSQATMAESEKGLEKIYQCLEEIDNRIRGIELTDISEEKSRNEFTGLYEKIRAFPAEFKENMDNDFNTAAVIGSFFELTRLVNKYLKKLGGEQIKPHQAYILREARNAITNAGEILGLFRENPVLFMEKMRDHKLITLGKNKEEIEKLINERDQARREKDFAKADIIRESLLQQHISLEDTPTGTKWRVTVD